MRRAAALAFLLAAAWGAPHPPAGAPGRDDGQKKKTPADGWIADLTDADPARRERARRSLEEAGRANTPRLLTARRADSARAAAIDPILETLWEMPAARVIETWEALRAWTPDDAEATEAVWKRLAALRGRAVGFLELLSAEGGEKGRLAGEALAAFRLVARGETLFFKKAGCASCHKIGAEGTAAAGPDLDGIGRSAEEKAYQMFLVIGRRISGADYLVEALTNPDVWGPEGYEKGSHPDLRAPPLSLTDDDIRALVVFLQALGGRPDPEAVRLPPAE